MQMKTVWKYTLGAEDYIDVDLPMGATVLSVQEQMGQPQMWVLVDESNPVYEQRRFRLAGTGHPINDENIKFVGTFQLYGGSFIGHLFEVL